MPCRSGFEEHERWESANLAREQLDNVTSLLCFTLKTLKTQHPVAYGSVVSKNTKLIDWYDHHMKVDRDRWIRHYQELHPSFSGAEIIKMVESGILTEV